MQLSRKQICGGYAAEYSNFTAVKTFNAYLSMGQEGDSIVYKKEFMNPRNEYWGVLDISNCDSG